MNKTKKQITLEYFNQHHIKHWNQAIKDAKNDLLNLKEDISVEDGYEYVALNDLINDNPQINNDTLIDLSNPKKPVILNQQQIKKLSTELKNYIHQKLNSPNKKINNSKNNKNPQQNINVKTTTVDINNVLLLKQAVHNTNQKLINAIKTNNQNQNAAKIKRLTRQLINLTKLNQKPNITGKTLLDKSTLQPIQILKQRR